MVVHGRPPHRGGRVAQRPLAAGDAPWTNRRSSRKPIRWTPCWTNGSIAEALDRLTPEHRAVIVECYYRGRSTAEAAEVLHIPVGTVKSRTHYALRALRLAMQEMGVTA